jgi:hypothetical protein
VKGDVKIEILVNNFIAANEYAKGGLMIRETLDPGSKHFSLTVSGTGDKGLRLYWRENTSGLSQNPYPAPDRPAPVQDRNIWLRIVKIGNQFQAYYKQAGTTLWKNAGESKTIQFSNDFYVGIAVTSKDNGQIATLKASLVDICDEPDIDIGSVGVRGTFEKALAGDIITGSGAGELQSSSGVIRPKLRLC